MTSRSWPGRPTTWPAGAHRPPTWASTAPPISVRTSPTRTPIQNDNITLPVLSFAGVDVDGSALLSLDVSGIDLAGSPIGDTLLDNLNIGVVPLSSQPLVPSPSLPSYLPPTVSLPAELEDVSLGSLGDAAPLAALNPADVSIADTPLSTLELGASPTETPLSDYQWASPSIGGATLLSDTTVPPAVAGIEVADLGLNAPAAVGPARRARPAGIGPVARVVHARRSRPGDEPVRCVSRSVCRRSVSVRLVCRRLVSPFGVVPFGVSPFGVSPFGVSPFGVSPFGVSPFGVSPVCVSPFGVSPFGVSPFGVSPFGVSPFGVSPFGVSPFGVSPFGVSPFGVSQLSSLGLNAPLTALPLDTMNVGGKPLGDYAISELAPTNLLFDLPLQPFVVAGSPLDCALIDCRQPNGFTIGDAVDAGALSGTLTLSEVQPALSAMYLGDLVGGNAAFTQAALADAIAAVDLTLEQAEDAGLSVVNIPIQLLPEFSTAAIEDTRLFFVGYRLIDLVGLNDDFTQSEFEQAVANWRTSQNAAPSTIGDLTARLDAPLGADELWVDFMNVAALSEADPSLTVAGVWPLLTPLRLEHLQATSPATPVTLDATGSARTIAQVQADPNLSLEGLLWGDVLGDLAAFTVADLTASFAGVTLGEFLRAAQPITEQKSELIDLSAIDLADYSSGLGVTYSVDVRIDDATRPHAIRLVAGLPSGSRYIDGTAVLSDISGPIGPAGDFEPTKFGDTLIWNIGNAQPGVDYSLGFETRSPEAIGIVPIGVTAQLGDLDVFATANSSVTFTEALEPNDAIGDSGVIALTTDEIVVSQISTAGDVDIFAVDLVAGDRVGGVLWNLPADYDLTIIGPASDTISPTSGRTVDVTGDAGSKTVSATVDAGKFPIPAGFAVVARSTNRALAAEVIDPIPVQESGRYYLVVEGYNGSNSQLAYAAQVQVERSPVTAPDCVARTFPSGPGVPGALPTSIPSSTNTLFVTDLARLGAIHTPAGAADVATALGTLVTDLAPGGQLESLGIDAAVIDVGQDPDVAEAMAAWDAGAVRGQARQQCRPRDRGRPVRVLRTSRHRVRRHGRLRHRAADVATRRPHPARQRAGLRRHVRRRDRHRSLRLARRRHVPVRRPLCRPRPQPREWLGHLRAGPVDRTPGRIADADRGAARCVHRCRRADPHRLRQRARLRLPARLGGRDRRRPQHRDQSDRSIRRADPHRQPRHLPDRRGLGCRRHGGPVPARRARSGHDLAERPLQPSGRAVGARSRERHRRRAWTSPTQRARRSPADCCSRSAATRASTPPRRSWRTGSARTGRRPSPARVRWHTSPRPDSATARSTVCC